MKFTVKEMILISIFAALTAIGAFIKIPMPYVPFTLQLFFCLMSGLIFGRKIGLWSQVLYVSLGLIGLPIFTEGGGIYYIFKPTFGYLIGFILCAYIVGILRDKYGNNGMNLVKAFMFCVIGLSVVYSLGVLHLYLILNFYIGKTVSIFWAIKFVALLFIGGDLLVCALSSLCFNKLKKVVTISI